MTKTDAEYRPMSLNICSTLYIHYSAFIICISIPCNVDNVIMHKYQQYKGLTVA